ncbi:hypothetical protein [Burkholderia ubonensis]|uniref:hypothetical protein n=1 Tax=Burkholderia ubonensis TaxID=101571 RepID=UPI000AC843FC|nr:hypothetical protein [Burkholderia ubonensis]
MTKIIYFVFLLLPLGSFAEACTSGENAHDDLSCTLRALDKSKKDLNAIYQKIYSSTQ